MTKVDKSNNFLPDADQVTVSNSNNKVCTAADSCVVDNYLQKITRHHQSENISWPTTYHNRNFIHSCTKNAQYL